MWLDASLRLDDSNADIHLFRGLHGLELPTGLEGFTRAISEFDAYLSMTQDATGYGYRGLAHLKAGHFDKAAQDFKKALAYGDNSRLYRTLGEAYYRGGRYDEALAALNRAVTTPHDPNQDCYLCPCTNEAHDWTYCMMGNIHRSRDDLATAIACFTKGVEAMGRPFGDSLLARAHAYKDSGDHELALADYRHFLDMGFIRPDVIAGAAECLYRQGKYEQAVRVHASEKHLHPRPADFPYPRPHYFYGMSFLKLGHMDKAAMHLHKARAMMEETDIAQRMPDDLRPFTLITDAELQAARDALASLGSTAETP